MADLLDTLRRVAPILVFLASITVVAELSDDAGVFEAAAAVAARRGNGSVRRLWLLVVVIAAATTVLLSLDTTAVLLTPVVLALASRLSVRPWPLALAVVWLANTASLLLPVSNLTNLLLVDRLGWSAGRYAARMWLPALVAVAVSVLLLALLLRASLTGGYRDGGGSPPSDRVLFGVAVGVCLAVGPLFVVGVPPWLVGVSAAGVLAVVFAVRRRSSLRVGTAALAARGGDARAVRGRRGPAAARPDRVAGPGGRHGHRPGRAAAAVRHGGRRQQPGEQPAGLPRAGAGRRPGRPSGCWRCWWAPTWARSSRCGAHWPPCCGASAVARGG